MRKNIYLSAEQAARMEALGLGMPAVIEAGLRALEGASPLLALSAELRESLTAARTVLDRVIAGKLAVVVDGPADGKDGLG